MAINCDSCDITLAGEPFLFQDRLYCCPGCAAGGPCVCTYEHDLGRFPPAHYARPVSVTELLDRYDRGIQKRAQNDSSLIKPEEGSANGPRGSLAFDEGRSQ